MNFQWISQTPSVNFPWNLAHSKNSTVKSRIFSRELGWSLVTRSVFVSVLMMLPADSKVVQSGAVLLLWTRIKTKMNWESYSMSRRFRHSCLKANKVSSSEETRKVEYADNFWKCAGAFYSKSVHAYRNYSLPKLACFLDTVYIPSHTIIWQVIIELK